MSAVSFATRRVAESNDADTVTSADETKARPPNPGPGCASVPQIYETARRFRSVSVRPPQIPSRSRVRRACWRHSGRTGQAAQTRFASASRVSRTAGGSWPGGG